MWLGDAAQIHQQESELERPPRPILDDIKFGEFSGREGDIISGVIQQGRNPDDVMVDLGKIEALLPVSD